MAPTPRPTQPPAPAGGAGRRPHRRPTPTMGGILVPIPGRDSPQRHRGTEKGGRGVDAGTRRRGEGGSGGATEGSGGAPRLSGPPGEHPERFGESPGRSGGWLRAATPERARRTPRPGSFGGASERTGDGSNRSGRWWPSRTPGNAGAPPERARRTPPPGRSGGWCGRRTKQNGGAVVTAPTPPQHAARRTRHAPARLLRVLRVSVVIPLPPTTRVSAARTRARGS